MRLRQTLHVQGRIHKPKMLKSLYTQKILGLVVSTVYVCVWGLTYVLVISEEVGDLDKGCIQVARVGFERVAGILLYHTCSGPTCTDKGTYIHVHTRAVRTRVQILVIY